MHTEPLPQGVVTVLVTPPDCMDPVPALKALHPDRAWRDIPARELYIHEDEEVRRKLLSCLPVWAPGGAVCRETDAREIRMSSLWDMVGEYMAKNPTTLLIKVHEYDYAMSAFIRGILRRMSENTQGWGTVSVLIQSQLPHPWLCLAFPEVDWPQTHFRTTQPISEQDVRDIVRKRVCRVPWPEEEALRLAAYCGYDRSLFGSLFSYLTEWEHTFEQGQEVLRELLRLQGNRSSSIYMRLERLAIHVSHDPHLIEVVRDARLPLCAGRPNETMGIQINPGPPGGRNWTRFQWLFKNGLIRYNGQGFVGACPLLQAYLDGYLSSVAGSGPTGGV